MRVASLYHQDTGLLTGTQLMVSDDAMLAANIPAGHAAIDGQHDHLSKKIDVVSGKVVDYQPPAPSADHEWNATSKRWQLNAAAVAKIQAAAAAKARLRELEALSVRHARAFLLRGDPATKAALQAVDDEINTLESAHGQ
jgi:hypothetical protein